MLRTAPALLLTTLALPAGAELYKWTDASGRLQFSDRPPAAQARKAETLEAPRATPLSGAAATPAAYDSAEQAQRQRRLSEAWRQEAEQREREERRAAAEKAERAGACEDLRHRLRSSEGRPAYITGENGEKEYLDDATRREYSDRANRHLQENCQ